MCSKLQLLQEDVILYSYFLRKLYIMVKKILYLHYIEIDFTIVFNATVFFMYLQKRN